MTRPPHARRDSHGVAALTALAVAACGPRGSAGDRPPAPRAALIVVVPDAAMLERTAELLAPVGGTRLAALGFAAGEPWPAATFADRGLRPDAPIGVAVTADGVVVRWAAVADAGRVATALDAVRGATRWRSEDAQLWRLGDTAIAVIAGDRVGVVSDGAGSRRERVALELASGAIDVTAEPAAGQIRLELDGAFLIATFAPEPGPVLAALGANLGRIRAALTAAPDVVAVDVEIYPTPRTFADRLLAGARGASMMTPAGLFALTSHLEPDDVTALLIELGERQKIDVPAVIQSARPASGSAITGDISIAPGAVAIRFADGQAMLKATRLLERVVGDRDHNNDSAVFGGHGGLGAGGGINLQPQWFAVAPEPPADPPVLPRLQDDNTDVPWSLEYRAARKQVDSAASALKDMIVKRRSALMASETQWRIALGSAIAIAMVPITGGYRGHGEWRPRRGTIAASVTEANAAFAELWRQTVDVDRAYAAAVAAHQHALEIRAKDVAAFDRQPRD